jgi:succinylarginine dihydrolase
VHFTAGEPLEPPAPALEAEQTTRALRSCFRTTGFAVHDGLPSQPHFADEGAANHVRLSADQGEPGVELMVWGREAFEAWTGRFPARQTREASEAVARRHGSRRPVLARQGRRAIEGGAFHNDVVAVGTRTCLLHHETAFEDTAQVYADIERAADGLFEPVFVEITEDELPLADAISSYLFNSMLVQPPGEDRLVLIAPAETCEQVTACRVAKSLPGRNGPIGRVEFIDVRQSMRNGRRSRLPAAAGGADRGRAGGRVTRGNGSRRSCTKPCGSGLNGATATSSRPDDLRDPQLLNESRTALDELTELLSLPGDFYPFQRV